MQIIRQKSTAPSPYLVMYAGADLTAPEIAALGVGWCDPRVSTTLAEVVSGVTLPAGFIPDCWTYNGAAWAVVAEKQDQVDVRLGMPSITVPVIASATPGAVLTTEGVLQSYVDLTWAAVSTATSYEIRYAQTTDANWSVWNVQDSRTASNTYRINGLVAGKAYKFGIRANCLWGLSAWSADFTATAAIPATAPANVVGFAGSFANNLVSLSWTLLDSLNLHTYEIRSGGSGVTWSAATVIRTGEKSGKWSFRPATAGPTTYLIKARDMVGNYSATAASVSITVPIAAAPTALATAGVLFGIDLAITYPQTPDIDYCEVWSSLANNRADVSFKMVGITRDGKFPDHGLGNAATRYYWARTKNVFTENSTWYPVSATAGVVGATVSNPSEVLSLLSASITPEALVTDLQALFRTGNIGGVPTLGLAGDMVIDGSLLARHIAANQLTVGENVTMGPNAVIQWANLSAEAKTNSDNSLIQVGGRNRQRNGDLASGTAYFSGNSVPVTRVLAGLVNFEFAAQVVATAANFGIYTFDGTGRCTSGQTYTLSFWAKTSIPVTITAGIEAQWTSAFAVTTQWARYSCSGVFNGVNNALVFYPQTACTMAITGVMLEEGTVATAWTPAPEDVQAGINAAATTATWANVSDKPTIPVVPSYITSTKITATTIESPTISAGTITGSQFILGNGTTYGKIETYDFANRATGIQILDGATPSITLKGTTVQSSNYVSGSAGWKIDTNGNAQFNSANIIDTLQVKDGAITANLFTYTNAALAAGTGIRTLHDESITVDANMVGKPIVLTLTVTLNSTVTNQFAISYDTTASTCGGSGIGSGGLVYFNTPDFDQPADAQRYSKFVTCQMHITPSSTGTARFILKCDMASAGTYRASDKRAHIFSAKK